MRKAAFLIALFLPAFAAAEEEGYLYLHRHAEIAERDGAQSAELFVYGASGAPVAAAGGGQFPSGELIPVAPGTYFVEVGRYRAPSAAARVQVESGRVTVVPSGWVVVRTPPLDAQPARGCSQWNAELSAFAGAAGPERAIVNSNRGSGVRTWGAIQLMAGPATIYFNEIPVTVEVVPDRAVELATGFQDPVFGARPLLATSREDDPSSIRLPLCEDGALQVPAGEYWASGAVATDVYPYERREWTRVTVVPEADLGNEAVRPDRLRVPVFEGEGATPQPLTEEERALISGQGQSGGSIRLPGFQRP
jgi:hypothetical protein